MSYLFWFGTSHKKNNDRIKDRGIVIVGDYVNVTTRTTFECSKGHQWNTSAAHILGGKSCPSCAEYGFNPNKPAVLYYIRVVSEIDTAYKIRITNRTVKDRFRDEINKITIIEEIHFEIGGEAYEMEQDILTQFVDDLHVGDNLLSSGNTEMFKRDIFEI